VNTAPAKFHVTPACKRERRLFRFAVSMRLLQRGP
jgi:hypothetical protein